MKNKSEEIKGKVLDFITRNPGNNLEAIKNGTDLSDILVRGALKALQRENVFLTVSDEGLYTLQSKSQEIIDAAESKQNGKKVEAAGAKKKEEDDLGEKTFTGRDNTKYRFGEHRNLPKGRLVHLLVKAYVEKNPKTTLTKLREVFHSDELQPRFSIAMEHTEARRNYSKGKIDRHFLAPDMLIKIADKKYAICNQWDAERINKLLKIVAGLGFKVKAETAE